MIHIKQEPQECPNCGQLEARIYAVLGKCWSCGYEWRLADADRARVYQGREVLI